MTEELGVIFYARGVGAFLVTGKILRSYRDNGGPGHMIVSMPNHPAPIPMGTSF